MSHSRRQAIKRFFFRGFLFFSIGYFTLFFAYNYLVTGHDDEKYLIHKFLNNKENIEAIAIGTSHAWAINFKALGINGIGLGTGGRDLQECRYILEFLLSQENNAIERVFISYSYFSLYQDPRGKSDSITDTRVFMYNNIPSWKMLPGDYKNFIVGKFFPFIQSDHWRSIAIRQAKKVMRLKAKLTSETAEAGNSEPSARQDRKKIPLKKIRARIAEQHGIHERAKVKKEYDIKAHNLKVLRGIIKMLKAEGIEVVFFTPPYYYKYTELYNDSYVKEMKGEMKDLVRNRGVTYLDYSTNEDFIYDPGLFQDADHINFEATKLLAKKITEDLGGVGSSQ